MNDSVHFFGIPEFVGGSGLSFLPNLQDHVEAIVWVNVGTSNNNWGGSSFGTYSMTSVTRSAYVDPSPAYFLRIPINSCASACRICDNFLCFRSQECFRSSYNRWNPIVNPWVHCWDDGREGLVNQKKLLKITIASVCNLSLPISCVGNSLQIAWRIHFCVIFGCWVLYIIVIIIDCQIF